MNLTDKQAKVLERLYEKNPKYMRIGSVTDKTTDEVINYNTYKIFKERDLIETRYSFREDECRINSEGIKLHDYYKNEQEKEGRIERIENKLDKVLEELNDK